MDKKQALTTAAIAFVAIVITFIVTALIFAPKNNGEITHLKESRTACQQIAQSYIRNTPVSIDAIENPSLYNRQQAKLAIDESQALATQLTDRCLDE